MQSPLHTRRSILKLLGTSAASAPFVTSGLMAAPPSNRIRHASFGTGGMAWSDLNSLSRCADVEIVAVCDVDLAQTKNAKKQFPNARIYQDWRELLEKESGNIDSVNVSTPDHMHAPIAVTAMKMGKHVYGQKPLAQNLREVRLMTDVAAETKVVTQMGIQVHSSAEYQLAARLIREEVIGKVKEIHSWCAKSWGDMAALPEKTDPVPESLDWDLWLGVGAERPFIGGGYYHPGSWRKRLDFGTGTLGDMGCHILDPLFMGLALTAPVAVRSEGPPPNAWNWALDGKAVYSFKGTAHTAGDFILTWYDGKASPPPEIVALLGGKALPQSGSILIGTDGVMLLPHVGRPELLSPEKFAGFKMPEVAGVNHYAQFIDACRGNGKTTADFAYGGPLTEAILLGCVASRFPKADLAWDAKALKFDKEEANAHVGRVYREGWTIPGLG